MQVREGVSGYRIRLCGAKRQVVTAFCALTVEHGLAALSTAETVILPGVDDPKHVPPPSVLKAIRAAARRGARIASMCTGAFVLAATGLLEGKRATTHWLAAAEMARQFPGTEVDPNVLYVDNGRILTAAGAAAAFDLCLYMVRKDYGAAVAARTAKACVMPLERAGGQAQFIEHLPPAADDRSSLHKTLAWIETHLDGNLRVEAIAKRAAVSVRTLHRRFVQQTGMTPTAWVLAVRLGRAQQLLETTRFSVERVSQLTGFGSTATFRSQFRSAFATSPLAHRRSFTQVSG